MKSISTFYARHHLTIILIISIILSLISFAYFYHEGLITAYGDSRAHLNISRRVVDSITPGFGQLGGAWLPLLHVLMLPMIWNDFLWQSGISGSVVNMIAYVLGMVFMYKLVYELTKKKLNASIAFIALALNINILYFQATPMTEMLFIATLIMALYFLYRWAVTKEVLMLITGGFFFMLSSLNRYEGWGVAVAAVIGVLIYSLVNLGKKRTESTVIMFSVIACLGIALWLLWQLVIFGDPFDFLHSDFAAGVNTARDIAAGLVPTYKNLPLSFLTEIYASFHTSGIIMTVLGFFSILAFIFWVNKGILNSKKALLLLALVPFFFEVLVVYRGIVPVHVPEIPIGDTRAYFNVRYALYFLPALIIFLTTITQRRVFMVVILLIVVLNNVLLFQKGTGVNALQENGIIKDAEKREFETIARIYNGQGYLLASTSGTDATLFALQIPMKKIINEGSGEYWNDSLKNPQKYATWILIRETGRDILNSKLNKEKVAAHFDLLMDEKGYKLYKIKRAPTDSI